MRSVVKAYAISIAALAAAVGLRWLLDPILGDTLPFVTLFGAVAAAVWVGGYLPALLVAVLGYLAVHYLFIPPRGLVELQDPATLVGLVAYLFTCSLSVAIGQAARNAQVRAAEGRERLRVTLRSIGDAVITTDLQGRVTDMNGVSEDLTGWTLAEAVGQPLDMVFRIVNEETRRSVENPAMRALHEGAVAGLANHTLLVHVDGSERPIDDSAAPIRDAEGRVAGCVLIFRDVSARRRVEREK